MIEASLPAAKPSRAAIDSAREPSAGTARAGGDSGIAEQFAALLVLLASGTSVAGATVTTNFPTGDDGKAAPTGGQSLPLAGSLLASQSLPTAPSTAGRIVPTTPASPNDTATVDAALLELANGGRAAETVASHSHRLTGLETLDQVLAAAPHADPPGAAAGGIESTLARADASMLSQALTVGSAPTPADARAASLPAGPLPSALPTPGTPDFDPALGERVLWMVQQGLQSARVRVHPEHLGPIDIRLKLDGDSAQITLTAAHVVARDALEQALPRLRDMLGHAGVTLTQADVSDRGAGARDSRSHLADAPTADDDAGTEGAASELVARRLITPAGLIDRFA
jgi:flagellar hook-length control protein FliK